MDSNRVKGLVSGIVSAVCYGTVPLFTLPLYGAGLSSSSVLVYRYAIAAVALAILVLIRQQSFGLKRNQILPTVVAGLMSASLSLCLYQAYRYMDAGVATALFCIYPILVAIIMVIFFKEKTTWITVLAIIMAVCGILLISKSSDGKAFSGLGLLFVFLSALSCAIYAVVIGRPSLRDIPSDKLTFWVLFIALIVFIVSTRFCTRVQPIPAKPLLWLDAFCLGLVPTVLALTLLSIGIRHIGATTASILSAAIEPVTAVFFGVIVFGEEFSLRIAIGILLVIIAVILVISGSSILSRLRSRLNRQGK